MNCSMAFNTRHMRIWRVFPIKTVSHGRQRRGNAPIFASLSPIGPIEKGYQVWWALEKVLGKSERQNVGSPSGIPPLECSSWLPTFYLSDLPKAFSKGHQSLGGYSTGQGERLDPLVASVQ